MNIILQHLELIERTDRLIRLQATGTPAKLSNRLGISKTTLYRVIKTMKELNAPILYDASLQSFVYEEPVGFSFGFYNKSKELMCAG